MSRNTVKFGLTRRCSQRRRAARLRRRALVLVVRFVLGLPLDGRRHSNCTFWTRGTRRVGYSPYLITWQWWALAAGWQRASIRLAVTAVAVLLMWAVLG